MFSLFKKLLYARKYSRGAQFYTARRSLVKLCNNSLSCSRRQRWVRDACIRCMNWDNDRLLAYRNSKLLLTYMLPTLLDIFLRYGSVHTVHSVCVWCDGFLLRGRVLTLSVGFDFTMRVYASIVTGPCKPTTDYLPRVALGDHNTLTHKESGTLGTYRHAFIL